MKFVYFLYFVFSFGIIVFVLNKIHNLYEKALIIRKNILVLWKKSQFVQGIIHLK